jgi:hypothetical protein
MLTVSKTAGKLLLFISLLSLAACNTPTPTAAPTQDLNLLRTEVASTVLARVPLLCALTPTATLSPTSTPTPTQTQTPTTTQITQTGTPGTSVANGDRAKWVSQSIQDDTRFAPGATFNMVWRIQNTGTTTWTTNYRLRAFVPERFGAPAEIFLTQEAAPNQIAEITIPMKAPSQAGEYRTDWVMSNENRANFKEPIYLKILVVASGSTLTATTAPAVTATPTLTSIAPTATPTVTPTATVTNTP